MKIYIALLVWVFSIELTQAQKTVQFVDSLSGKLLVGVSIGIPSLNLILVSDLEGKTAIPALQSDALVYISNLGYEKKIYSENSIPSSIKLSPIAYQLKETVIKPIDAKDYIQWAFDSFQKNHVPEIFKQRVFYREEFIVNNSYLRFQELEMNIYQFPKMNDRRKHYKSGSYPEVINMYRIDDYKRMNEVKYAVGKLIADKINFNQFSLYSYAKGTNILNLIFTELLSDDQARYRRLPDENIKGYNAIHIQGEHYSKDVLLYTTHIYIEPQTMAILHFNLLATEENVVKHWIDFKTRILLWVMGIKINVAKFYCKINFEKNNHGFWTVSDYMAMCPFSFKKKAKLDCMVMMNYRMENKVEETKMPSSNLYGKNQTLFNQYSAGSRFADKLSYSIPLIPTQKERLKKMVEVR